MIPLDGAQPAAGRVDEDDEEIFDMDLIDEDDADFEQLFAESGQSEGRAANQERVPVWRLIEMSRENRALKWSMADIADYDDFEDFDGELADESSY